MTAREILTLLERLEAGSRDGGLSVEDYHGVDEEADALVRKLALAELRRIPRAEVAAAAIELRGG